MNRYVTLAASVVGAGTLVGCVLTQALASAPPFRDAARSNAVKHYNIKGALTITDVLKVQKNLSDYGKVYAHGGAQVWQGLLIHSGGVKTDSLAVSGVLQAATGNIGGVSLQGGAMSGASLTTTGDARIGGALTATGNGTVNGTLTVAGKVTGNGVDAGAGGLTTSGSINGGSLTASAINTSGALSAGSISSGGTIATTGTLQAGTLKVTSGVDFSGAQVTGLNLSNVNLNNATLSQLGVTGTLTAGALTLGTTSSTSNPLTVQGNGQSATLGVNSSGALAVSNLAVANNQTVAGGLTVSGSSGITAPILQSTSSSSGLTLQGSPVVIKGNTTLSNTTTLANGSDLNLTASSSGTATHINAASDTDIAGNLALSVGVNTSVTENTASYTFAKAYGTTPVVVVTPTDRPAESTTNAGPQYWVTSTTSGFTIHYRPGAPVTTAYTVHFNYHVVGS